MHFLINERLHIRPAHHALHRRQELGCCPELVFLVCEKRLRRPYRLSLPRNQRIDSPVILSRNAWILREIIRRGTCGVQRKAETKVPPHRGLLRAHLRREKRGGVLRTHRAVRRQQDGSLRQSARRNRREIAGRVCTRIPAAKSAAAQIFGEKLVRFQMLLIPKLRFLRSVFQVEVILAQPVNKHSTSFQIE